MPATTTIDDGFPGKVERSHFFIILGGIAVFGAALMTFWALFD